MSECFKSEFVKGLMCDSGQYILNSILSVQFSVQRGMHIDTDCRMKFRVVLQAKRHVMSFAT